VILLLWLAAAEGRPLFYWGARPAVVATERTGERSAEARVLEVHAATDGPDLVLRFTFDRPVREAMRLPDGAPVSGRLRALLYVDSDNDGTSGLDMGPQDARTGADRRIEVGVIAIAEDPEERRKANAVVSASLASVARDGRRRTLWRADDSAQPDRVSAHGEWVELRLPADRLDARAGARVVLAEADQSWEGRLRP
jgi:hypothetical protein